MESNIHRRLMKVDTSDLPSFDDCRTILHKALWVLWVAKDKLRTRKLTSEQIASIFRDVMEVSIEPGNITQALKRAGDRVHCYRDNGQFFYEIMKAGKDYLMSLKGTNTLEVFYFEPGQKYSSKKVLTTSILNNLSGELGIVDPYCGERTLDVIKDVKSRPIKFLTRLESFNNDKIKNEFLRELQDFKAETVGIEFRDYPNKDLHDRYIISSNCLVLLGHSIKDLGAKESFAIVLDETSCKNIYEALSENFNKRWQQSTVI